MNTITATTRYASPVPQATTRTRAVPAAANAGNWLERLALWYESRPSHRRMGSYTLLLQLRASAGSRDE